MYIKNQVFKDENTLLELLFDFSLGVPSGMIEELFATIQSELANNETYTQYYQSLADEDDRVELFEEERSLRLAEKLMELFDAFEVQNSSLYGLKQGQRTLLYQIHLY
jgi:hypothetical protein